MPVLSPAVYINELHLQKKTVRESSNSLFLPIVSSFVFLLPMRITFPKSQHLIQKKGLTCSATKPEIYCSGFVGVPSHHFDIIAKKTFRKLTFIIYCNQRAQTDGFAEQNGRDAERADLTCRY